MKVGLIPAAGKGSRLGLPFPKELYPLICDGKYKPASERLVEQMTSVGVEHIVFVTNPSKFQLMEYFGNGHRFNCDISYVIQEEKKELAGAIDTAYHLTKDNTVYFGMPDTYMEPFDIYDIEQKGAVSMITFTTKHPEKMGMLKLKDDRVIRVVDKPQITNLTKSWGALIYTTEFTEYIHNNLCCDYAELMNSAIESGLEFYSVEKNNNSYTDLGTYSEIIEFSNGRI